MASEASQRDDARCVDHYFEAAQFSWQEIESRLHEKCVHDSFVSAIYRSSLNALVTEGQKYQRFDPRIGLRVQTHEGWIKVPCIYCGFNRNPNDFNSLFAVGDYTTNELNHLYRQNGLGVPIVAVRSRTTSDDFQRKQSMFSATLILRSNSDDSLPNGGPLILEFHNPLESSTVVIQESDTPLAFDKSAPVAKVLSTTQRNYFEAFLQPSSVTTGDSGLFMLEPYVAGKMPVLMVHGLLSDRLTWANVVNELRSCDWFNDRFQIWVYQYPTGEPFLGSAARLRRQLVELSDFLDPDATDPALDHMVMVGHSMGGLINKLQISQSGDTLWNAIAELPFEAVQTEPQMRERLREAFFFEASPIVSRVVFVGTPHRGSVLAQRAIGRLGSLLIEEPPELKKAHRKLLEDNPGVFSNEFSNRVPTSVDLLAPDSRLLKAIDQLPLDPSVKVHSIVGQGRWMLGSGDSDGVVPVSSAKQANALSEKMVMAKHSDLNRNPDMIEELLRILREHLIEAHVERE